MDLVRVRLRVVLGALVGAPPQTHAELDVLVVLLQRLLDTARVQLERARVQLDALEAELALRLLLRDDGAVAPQEDWLVAHRGGGVDYLAVLIELSGAARRQEAQVLFDELTARVAEVEGGSEKLLAELAKKGLLVGNGYSQFKNKHIRIANFPTHSKEQIELLVDTINQLEF